MSRLIIFLICLLAIIGIFLIPNKAHEKELIIEIGNESDNYLIKTSPPIIIEYKFAKTEYGEYVEDLIVYWSNQYDYKDIEKGKAIVYCEGGYNNPNICNKQYGCTSGQGPAQFIPSTWRELQKEIGVKDVFNPSENIQGMIYLLKKDGDRHWRPYSGHCWLPLIKN